MKKMRVALPGLFVGFFVLISVLSVAATYDFDFKARCQDDDCQQGHNITWNFTYYNHGVKVIRLYEINLRNVETGVSIGNYASLFEIAPKEKRELGFTSVLPAPNMRNQLVYNVCFTRKVNVDDWWVLGYEVNRSEFIDKNLEFCYDDNYSLYVKPTGYCPLTRYCRDDEVCVSSKCQKLNCTSCQYAYDHACVDFECCDSTACPEIQECLDHTCSDLVCGDGEVIVDHACITRACAFDEQKSGFFCVKLNCSFDEKPVDHRCVKIYCNEGQIIKDHGCVDVSCPFLQKLKGDKCGVDSVKVLILIFILLVVLASPFIYYYKHKKDIRFSHQRHCPRCSAVLGPRDSFCYNCRFDLKIKEGDSDEKKD